MPAKLRFFSRLEVEVQIEASEAKDELSLWTNTWRLAIYTR